MKYRMDEITESCLGKMLDAKKNKGEYQPYLANINVRWGSFDLEKLSLMRFEKDEEERYGIKYGDLIMCEGGEPGRCAIWRDELPNMKIQKALHRIRPNTELVDVEYLQKKLDRETHTLIQLRDWLLPVLMNGQATISD